MIHFNSFNLLLPGLSYLLPNTQTTQVLHAMLFMHTHTNTHTHALRKTLTDFPNLCMGPIELFEGKINNQDKLKGALSLPLAVTWTLGLLRKLGSSEERKLQPKKEGKILRCQY